MTINKILMEMETRSQIVKNNIGEDWSEVNHFKQQLFHPVLLLHKTAYFLILISISFLFYSLFILYWVLVLLNNNIYLSSICMLIFIHTFSTLLLHTEKAVNRDIGQIFIQLWCEFTYQWPISTINVTKQFNYKLTKTKRQTNTWE